MGNQENTKKQQNTKSETFRGAFNPLLDQGTNVYLYILETQQFLRKLTHLRKILVVCMFTQNYINQNA